MSASGSSSMIAVAGAGLVALSVGCFAAGFAVGRQPRTDGDRSGSVAKAGETKAAEGTGAKTEHSGCASGATGGGASAGGASAGGAAGSRSAGDVGVSPRSAALSAAAGRVAPPSPVLAAVGAPAEIVAAPSELGRHVAAHTRGREERLASIESEVVEDETDLPTVRRASRSGSVFLGDVSTMWPIIIGVGGASGSGKTTIATILQQRLPRQRVVSISSDSYYKPLGEGVDASSYNFDHPQAVDADLIVAHLSALKRGEAIEVPEYDFKTHKRLAMTHRIEGATVVILDGIFTLAVDAIRKACDITIFTHEDLDVCLARRLLRDTRERGRTLESVLLQYQRFVKPGYHTFIAPTMREADLIIPRARENIKAIEMLARDIQAQLASVSCPTPNALEAGLLEGLGAPAHFEGSESSTEQSYRLSLGGSSNSSGSSGGAAGGGGGGAGLKTMTSMASMLSDGAELLPMDSSSDRSGKTLNDLVRENEEQRRGARASHGSAPAAGEAGTEANEDHIGPDDLLAPTSM